MLKALLEKDDTVIDASMLVAALRKIDEVELSEKLAEQNGEWLRYCKSVIYYS